MTSKQILDVACVVPAGDLLGEGPCWSPQEGRLYWFDIERRMLSWWMPDTGTSGGFRLPMRASAAATRRDGGLIVATEAGVGVVDTAGALRITHPMKLPRGFRSNDGKIDGRGRFWWSTMDEDGGTRPGSIYRLDPGSAESVLALSGVHIPNTLTCTALADAIYIADSLRQTMFVHGVDADTGRLDSGREFAHTRGEAGTPDGSALDAEGFLWNAQWGGWRVVRYAPNGRVDRVVTMPVEQPTSCAFGGADLRTLYVTSARTGLSPQALKAQPKAGGLFAFTPGVAGLPLPMFSG